MKKEILQIEQINSSILLEKFDALNLRLAGLEDKIQHPSKVELMTIQEVADFYSVSKVTVHDWANKRLIKKYRIGNKVRFKRKEIEEALVPIRK